LREDHFIYFFTVFGFFLRLLFSIAVASEIFDILVYTSLITFFFFIWIHLVLIFFSRGFRFSKDSFPKYEHEEFTDYIVKEIENRERDMHEIISFIESLSDEDDKKLSKSKN